jgi:hypothetical protein
MNLFAPRARSKATLFAPVDLPHQLAKTKSLHGQAEKVRRLPLKITGDHKVK